VLLCHLGHLAGEVSEQVLRAYVASARSAESVRHSRGQQSVGSRAALLSSGHGQAGSNTLRSCRSRFHPDTPRESRVMKRSMMGDADARPG
jgi:hypothetical protein